MGSSQSTPNKSPGNPGVVNAATLKANMTEEMKKEVLKGDSLIIDKALKPDLEKITTLFKNFNYHDPDQIKQYIDTINQSLGNTPIKLSDEIIGSMAKVHEALSKKLSTTATVEDKRKALSEMPLEDMFKNISEYFGNDVDQQKKVVFDRLQLQPEDKMISDPLNAMFNTIKELKVRYKFFEYKYVELNIFMILFVQFAYDMIRNFTTQVIAFNAVREDNRKQVMKEILTQLNDMMTSAGVKVEAADYETLRKMLGNLQNQMDSKNKEMQDNLNKLMEVSTENMSGFVSALSKATQEGLLKELNNKQGGFVRDHSRFPQAFYDLGAGRTAS